MKNFSKLLLFATLLSIPSTAFAGGFVSKKGSIFVKTAFQSWTADKVFAGEGEVDEAKDIQLGDKAPFNGISGGEFSTQHISLCANYVPIERLQLDLFLPVFQVSSYKDAAFDSSSKGIGDLYLGAGYQVLKFNKFGTTINLKSKVPLASPNEDQRSIPISTGQFDFTAEQQSSWAAKPALQFTFRTLYRYRLAASGETQDFDYRDEVELGLEMAGSPVNTVWLKLGVSSLMALGSDDLSSTETTENSGDQIHDFYLGAYWNVGHFLPFAKGLALDAVATVPYAGQDYPRGITWNAGFAYSF